MKTPRSAATYGVRAAGSALALLLLGLLGVLGAACSESGPAETKYYDAYIGDAYPDQRPKVVVPPDGMAIVSDSRSDTLSLLDLGDGKRFATYPVGREPVTIDGPHHVAVDPAAGFVYVALSYPAIAGASGPHAAHGSSTLPGYVQKLSMDDMRVVGQVRVDPNPGDIVLSEDGKRVVVSHFDLKKALDNPGNLDKARSTLAVIDPATLALSGSPDATRIPLCIAAHGVVLSKPDGAKAYVACYGEDSLAIVNTADPSAEVERIPVGADAAIGNPTYGPYAMVMSPDGKTIAVSSTVSKDVRFFDVASGAFDLTKTIKTQGAPYFVAWSMDSARLYIPTQDPDALSLVDTTQDNMELKYRDLSSDCERPHLADFNGGASLFVVCEGDQTAPGDVVELDPTTLDTMVKTEVGVYPDAFQRVAAGGGK